MEDYTVKRLALVLSVQAEIEGMKANNLIQTQIGGNAFYREEAFNKKANELKNFAYISNEQL